MVITIDGMSSTGKSSFAKRLAKKMGYTYVDSGAMFRALTVFGIDRGVINATDKTIYHKDFIDSIADAKLSFKCAPKTNENEILLNGENVEKRIRTPEISDIVSEVAKIDEVRQKLLQLQRVLGKNGNIIMEGRDIGTKVFPNADLKLFLTASLKVRAQRRYKELLSKNYKVEFESVLKSLDTRDSEDSNRVISPLKSAEDAVLIDNTKMSIEDQIALVEKILEK